MTRRNLNPQRMKESPKKHDVKDEPLGEYLEGIR